MWLTMNCTASHKIYMLAVLVFFTFCATSCPYDFDVDLVDIELYNIDFSGEEMIESSDPIKKEGYIIGVKYLVSAPNSTDEESWYYTPENKYGDTEHITNIKEKPKVFCLSDFSGDYTSGSDISHLFTYGNVKNSEMHILLVLKTQPDAGTHLFKVQYQVEDGTLIEKSIEVTLY